MSTTPPRSTVNSPLATSPNSWPLAVLSEVHWTGANSTTQWTSSKVSAGGSAARDDRSTITGRISAYGGSGRDHNWCGPRPGVEIADGTSANLAGWPQPSSELGCRRAPRAAARIIGRPVPRSSAASATRPASNLTRPHPALHWLRSATCADTRPSRIAAGLCRNHTVTTDCLYLGRPASRCGPGALTMSCRPSCARDRCALALDARQAYRHRAGRATGRGDGE
jgi:hypothetical protein